MMTELEMCITLGIVTEPEKNRIHVDRELRSEIMYLKSIFEISECQKMEIGTVNFDTWADFLPWHSLN